MTSWPTDWMVYTCYDGIVVKAQDMLSMPAQVASAILHYVQCGGSLLVLGSWNPPQQWSVVTDKLDIFDMHYVGFGVCAVTQRDDTSAWDSDRFKFLKEQVWSLSSSALMQKKSIADTNIWFPVVGSLTMPVRGLFVLVLFFAIVIGPVNLLLLSRKNMRIWILWTAPMLSIVASLASSFTPSTSRAGADTLEFSRHRSG